MEIAILQTIVRHLGMKRLFSSEEVRSLNVFYSVVEGTLGVLTWRLFLFTFSTSTESVE